MGLCPGYTEYTWLDRIFHKPAENMLVRLNLRDSIGRAVAVQEGRGRLHVLPLSGGGSSDMEDHPFRLLAVPFSMATSQIHHIRPCRIKG